MVEHVLRWFLLGNWPESMILTLSSNLLSNKKAGSDFLKLSHRNTCKFMDKSIVSSWHFIPNHKLTETIHTDVILFTSFHTVLTDTHTLIMQRPKFFTRLLQRSIQAFDRSTTHRVATGTNPDLPSAFFSAFEDLGERSKRTLVII